MPFVDASIGSILLCLELDDLGFDHSVLCEFRTRLLEGGAERILFDKILCVPAVSPREKRKYLRSSLGVRFCLADDLSNCK